jgi:hypothetical protein
MIIDLMVLVSELDPQTVIAELGVQLINPPDQNP